MSAGDEKPGTRSKRPRILTVVLVVITAGMIVFSITLAVMFTVPLKSVERTDVDWFGANLVTLPSGEGAHFYFDPSFFCTPSNAIGNLTISLAWESNDPNTTARLVWITPGPPIVNHVVYSANNTSAGGYSFPPSLSTFLCDTFNEITGVWVTSQPGVDIALTGVKEYNYTATAPIW